VLPTCSGFVWILRYKAILAGKLISRTHFTAAASLKLKSKLQTAITKHELYDTTDRKLTKYQSAFYTLLKRPVQTADREKVVASLQGKWKTAQQCEYL